VLPVGSGTVRASAKADGLFALGSDFTVEAGGDVGIGTTNPSSKLVVNDTGQTFIDVTSASEDYTGLRIGNNGTANQANFLVDADGNLQIDSTTSTDSGQTILLKTGSVERMRIDSDGNVGIGTTSPDFKLQVNGDIAPETNATFDLGTSVLAWDNVYAVTYNDLTPAWVKGTDGSAKNAIAKISNNGKEINHTSYPIKLRSKFYTF